MKKKILMLITICMMIFGIVAYADSDAERLQQLTTDQVQYIKELVDIELANRFGDKSDTYISKGTYVVGDDIKAGSYKFIALNLADSSYSGRAWIYETEETYERWKESRDSSDVLYDAYYENNDSVLLDLEDGNVLVLEYYGGSIEEVKSSWRP